ncbi:hypothetical protein [Streptomyces diastatochromogenes]
MRRRLGVADDLRKIAVPSDHRAKVTWATSAVGWWRCGTCWRPAPPT